MKNTCRVVCWSVYLPRGKHQFVYRVHHLNGIEFAKDCKENFFKDRDSACKYAKKIGYDIVYGKTKGKRNELDNLMK